MSDELKRKALLLLLVATAMTVLVGAGLPRLQFQPGLPLPALANGEVIVPAEASAPPLGISANAFLEVLFLIILGTFLGYLVYRIIKGVDWKQLLKELVSFLVKLCIPFAILFLILNLLPKTAVQPVAVPLPEPPPIVRSPLGPTPPLLIWLAGIGLLAGVVAAGAWMLRPRRDEPSAWELGALEARDALLAGADFKNVILRCYDRLSRALATEQDIERELAMTAGEFERLLAEHGLPRDPVHQLTRLFEQVRYGAWQPNPADEQVALASLDAILAASRQAGRARGQPAGRTGEPT